MLATELDTLPIDKTSLGLFQRVLLGTDGTVTYLLETYARESVVVTKLSERVGKPCELSLSPARAPGLALQHEDSVIHRRVLLTGTRSGRTLICAEALVLHERLGSAVRHGLLYSDKPIGKLLKESRCETFREILWIGCEQARDCAAHFGIEPTAELLCRTYRLLVGGRPVILITERFPATAFLDAS
jgi:chorismate-pyruvate lyase